MSLPMTVFCSTQNTGPSDCQFHLWRRRRRNRNDFATLGDGNVANFIVACSSVCARSDRPAPHRAARSPVAAHGLSPASAPSKDPCVSGPQALPIQAARRASAPSQSPPARPKSGRAAAFGSTANVGDSEQSAISSAKHLSCLAQHPGIAPVELSRGLLVYRGRPDFAQATAPECAWSRLLRDALRELGGFLPNRGVIRRHRRQRSGFGEAVEKTKQRHFALEASRPAENRTSRR